MGNDQVLREQLTRVLRGGLAHLSFADAVKGIPVALRGRRPRGYPHSLWELLEHMRIGQWDILEFSRDPKHVSPAWPEGYWPGQPAPPSNAAWLRSIRAFQADLEAIIDLVRKPGSDLFTPFAHGDGQNLLREALLVADHNAYHLGQIVAVRRMLGAWKA